MLANYRELKTDETIKSNRKGQDTMENGRARLLTHRGLNEEKITGSAWGAGHRDGQEAKGAGSLGSK